MLYIKKQIPVIINKIFSKYFRNDDNSKNNLDK